MGVINPVLIVEDDPDLAEAMSSTLELAKYQTIHSDNAESALKIIESQPISLIISDVQMPGMDGFELLRLSKRRAPEIPFVLVTAYGSVPKAVEAIREGASDYIIKPFEAEILIEVVDRLAMPELETGEMIAADSKTNEITELARRVAKTDVSVMISGESGSGKEVFSQFIHANSTRHDQPFVAINCAAIPETMLESMLFGYEKGAFTGAYSARAGKFEQANNGTLLLDEISEMELGLQAKLLRVIQEKEVERLGSNKTTPLNVRIIATTNRNLKAEVAAGRFREDLFYRLNVFPIRIPPLRDRTADILPLTQRVIKKFNPGANFRIDKQAEQKLLQYFWPGNIRELENVVQRAMILMQGPVIMTEDIVFEHQDTLESVELAPELSEAAPLESDLKTLEKEIIIGALVNNSSRKEAAEKLGISPRTLRYKLAQFRKAGITIPGMTATARAS